MREVKTKKAKLMLALSIAGGEDGIRTHDLLTASQKNNFLILYKIY